MKNGDEVKGTILHRDMWGGVCWSTTIEGILNNYDGEIGYLIDDEGVKHNIAKFDELREV